MNNVVNDIFNNYNENILKFDFNTILFSKNNIVIPSINNINNISIDYVSNLQIYGIRFTHNGYTIFFIPYTFIETFYKNCIIFKKNKLIIDFSFIYDIFLLDLNFPEICLLYSASHIQLVGSNINNFKLSCEFTDLETKYRMKLGNTNFMKQTNFLLQENVIISNNLYIINIKKVSQTIGVFIKNININNIESIYWKFDENIYSICEDITELYNKCKKFKNGIYLTFNTKDNNFEISNKKIICCNEYNEKKLIIKMDNILSDIIPETFFICPDILYFKHQFLYFPIECKRE
ncbi:MAG: hypothetical protein CMF62_01790 [Magnetococcales bacterium]|nr:hypothetical protein [Magnetococcales bacterium]|tara:strand:+ start:85045 stop:85917 length:873 start_codon:yes stop_codon:yes gene_type:complete